MAPLITGRNVKKYSWNYFFIFSFLGRRATHVISLNITRRLMERWNSLRYWLDENQDYFVDVLRIYLGVALFVKGLYFIQNVHEIHETIGSGGIAMGQAFLSHFIPAIHIVGGLLMAVGLLTRFSALIQIPILAGAVFLIHWREGLFSGNPSLELTGLVLICLIMIAGHGAGRLSTDNYLAQHKETTERKPSFAQEESLA
jgi:uncharacterized membrane protein YphA (DoxX/SURF4 family)